MPNGLIIALDFDGTLVRHAYPDIGFDTGGAYWLSRCVEEHGARTILWTMRSGERLAHAVDWCGRHGIQLWAVNENPEQGSWSESPKAYAHVYVDDAAFGAPLVHQDGARPYLDWRKVGPALLAQAEAFAKREGRR